MSVLSPSTDRTLSRSSCTVLVLVLLLSGVALPLQPAVAQPPELSLSNQDSSVTAAEVGSTLRSKVGDLLSQSDNLNTASDADSAIQTAPGGNLIDIPKDPEQGVKFTAQNGPQLEIELPNANTTKDAQQVAPGTVAYSSDNGSANAVQATENGELRMLTIIDNSGAPTAYDYTITIAEGSRISIADNGGALVHDAADRPVAAILAPWAKDADGNSVATYFTTDGKSLTQHIKHTEQKIAYPVVADPTIACGWPRCTVYLNKSETRSYAYWGVIPQAPIGAFSSLLYIATMTHRWFAIQYANRGMCVGFNLSALPWERQGLFGYYC